MINSVTLTNFRKHENLHLDFDSGFTLFRAGNEAGKTTVIEGVCYALLGSKALRTSIEAAVTRGLAVNSLKSSVQLSIEGSDVRVTRSKGAAEMHVDGKLSCTGQADVTAAVCKLLGVEPKHLTSLLVAQQGEVRGLLLEGATADRTINTLANLDQLEILIERVQTKYDVQPSRFIQQAIDQLEEKLGAEAVPAPSETEVKALTEEENIAEQAYAALVSERSQYDVKQASAQIAEHKQAVAHNARCVEMREKAAAMPKPLEPDQPRSLIAEITAQESQVQAQRALRAQYLAAPLEHAAALPAEVFAAKLTLTSEKVATARGVLSDISKKIAVLRALKINETTCGLCGKDVSEVPEVVEKNLQADRQLAELEEQQVGMRSELGAAEKELAALEELRAIDRKAAVPKGLWEPDGTVPQTYSWRGPVPLEPVSRAAELSDLKKQWAQFDTNLSEWNDFQRQFAGMEPMAVSDITGAQTCLATADVLDAKVRAQLSAVGAARAACKQAQARLAHASAEYQADKALRAQTTADLKAAKEKIKVSRKVETLVKKLRDLRPVLAAKVWGVVLSSISHFFSQIRGDVSRVTRDEDGFAVDGQPVAALSGSTLDSLGLAMRLALIKVFCPAASWLVLDEAASACDEERELAMLATLKTSGFRQVLLVSHSSAGDAVADHLCTL
jgi:DNA repair exonuclease SbcCD ATPase subunit